MPLAEVLLQLLHFGCITDNKEKQYRDIIENLVGWCGRKTKELVVAFLTLSTNEEGVAMVDTYRFL